MPELPEVETTRRGITPHLASQTISKVIVRQRQLRWPIPSNLNKLLSGQTITAIDRRAKYLLLNTTNGTLIIHLGMSGSLRVLLQHTPATKHDHIDILLNNGSLLRLRDPRRFGAVLWSKLDPSKHKLLHQLGVEPLSRALNGEYLFNKAKNRKIAIKQMIMDSHIVVGIGNIYANEALFVAGILPSVPAGNLTMERMDNLSRAIKKVLNKAIKSGGTSLRDFVQSDGKPGYFQQQLNVYNRSDQTCLRCGNPISMVKQGQRATYFCSHCQH